MLLFDFFCNNYYREATLTFGGSTMSVMSDFLSRQNEEMKASVQEGLNNASDELSSKQVSVPGNYLCEVAAFAFRDKKKNKVREYPELYISEEKGSLNLNVCLKVVDGTPKVPKGSSVYKNITIAPGAVNGQNPTKETIDKVMRFTKPNLVMLTGNKNVNFTDEWINEWLLAKFEERSPEKFVMVKDHKMKEKVMCLVDYVAGRDGTVRLSVKNMTKAQPGDKSESFDIPIVASNVNIPVGTTPAPNFTNMVETEDGDIPHHIPDVEDFNA
jgi:hypothetical protein